MQDSTFQITSPILTLHLAEATSETYVARLIGSDIQVDTQVFHYGGDYLGDFLSSLARDWRGWKDERSWSSLEGTLVLRATISKAGAVTFDVHINERAYAWEVRGRIYVENGRLDDIASRGAAFCKLLGAAP